MKKTNNSLRIIGGAFRGKKITFPDAEGLRPTSDRIRETLFNWLMHDIRTARCLDLFAGSGALGFEAHSRGAAQVVLVEKNPVISRHLNQIAVTFDAETISIQAMSAEQYLLNPSSNQFDIVFLDPPFSHMELFACIQQFEQSDLLKKQGLLYVEAPQALKLNPSFWQPLKVKTAGQVTYALYRLQANS